MKEMQHIITGQFGERMACNYLIEKDFEVLYRNWKYKNIYEIDIIAEKNDVVHFIEVKTRHSTLYGYPEEAVTAKKFRCLQRGAEAFQKLYPKVKKIQFDILSVLILPRRQIEYLFIEDFYYYS